MWEVIATHGIFENRKETEHANLCSDLAISLVVGTPDAECSIFNTAEPNKSNCTALHCIRRSESYAADRQEFSFRLAGGDTNSR